MNRIDRRLSSASRWLFVFVIAATLAIPSFAQSPAGPAPKANQQTFASPDEAVNSLKTAVASADLPAINKMFGPAIAEIASGDPVADKAGLALFAKRLGKMTHLVKRDDSTMILHLGAENWPFQFPIVKSGDRWFFDGDAGLIELDNRRIGANELATIRICREYIRVQTEYADEDRDADEVLEYAQRFQSRPGTKDGLYWADDSGEESPLGPLFASAAADGYALNAKPQPFHGYNFRILTRQGKNAPGGAYGYVINGNMIGGYALVAYPATWGKSGMTTFIVNQQGKVFQKDLGPRTAAIAAAMTTYDPDSAWTAVNED